MTTAAEERTYWDCQATDDTAARHAVWAETGHDWNERVDLCLDVAVRPVVGDCPRPRLLDLGCGIGRLSIAAAQRWSIMVIGVDVSQMMLRLANQNASAAGVGVLFELGDGRRLPENVGRLCGAWSMLLFQHLPSAACAGYVSEISDRLMPGARFRFQYVEGYEHAPFSHGFGEDEVSFWCDEAGLKVDTIDKGLIYPQWSWVTAVKP